jgi:hypothetical protein
MNDASIFSLESKEANAFYKEFGFVHYRIKSSSFLLKINKCFEYYSELQKIDQKNVAFRNKEGKPRHFIDVFRDKNSGTLDLFEYEDIYSLIMKKISSNNRFIFTHSKMSFKQIESDGDWHPHQDNGYKVQGDIREGFAIFICLEDMNEYNGCLQIFPGSQKLGLLDHSRVIEDKKTGDNQFFIKDIPHNIIPKSIIAKKGDILIFSSNTIHQSLSSKNSSKRLSLIAEIESFDTLKLDDYGKVPIFAVGLITPIENIILIGKSVFSPYLYWRFIKKSTSLALLIRKIKYKFS